MNKLKKALFVSVTAISVIGSVLTSTYTCTLAAKLDDLKRTSRTEGIYLRARIRELESELTEKVIDRLEAIVLPTKPVGGEEESTAVETTIGSSIGSTEPGTEASETLPESIPADGMVDETDINSETETETEPESESDIESVTLPTHLTPETQPPLPDDDLSASLYVIAEMDGRIGVFDAMGSLLRTVNVFVFTLPEADREALEVGIPAYSWEEAVEIVERYE